MFGFFAAKNVILAGVKVQINLFVKFVTLVTKHLIFYFYLLGVTIRQVYIDKFVYLSKE